MILDSSAIVAIVRAEPGYEEVLAELEAADSVAIGSPTLVETGMVLTGRLGLDARALLERFVQDFGVMVIPFGEAHWREALDAFRRFGKKRHPAALNFGDCLTYAVARLSDRPLLCLGNDFSQTDLRLSR